MGCSFERQKSIKIINACHNMLYESGRKSKKKWVDKVSDLYKRSKKSWLQGNYIEAY